MSEQGSIDGRAVRGVIRRRVLVNAVVDPDEAAGRLPAGLRPHLTGDATVVGCCLLAIEHIRPAGVPMLFGIGLRAAAHRISVEWDDEWGTTVGVYVPLRHTDSLPARMLGGRWFPGVHDPARIDIAENSGRLRWTVGPRRHAERYGIRVEVSVARSDGLELGEPVAGTCLTAAIGLSPGHHGVLEAARMEPNQRAAQRVDVVEFDSHFLAGFASARPAPSYLMRDVQVRWTPASAPRCPAREAAA